MRDTKAVETVSRRRLCHLQLTNGVNPTNPTGLRVHGKLFVALGTSRVILTSTTDVLMPTPDSPSVTTVSAARSPIEYARVTVYWIPSSPEARSKNASRTTIPPPRVGISARAS